MSKTNNTPTKANDMKTTDTPRDLTTQLFGSSYSDSQKVADLNAGIAAIDILLAELAAAKAARDS